jgi:hypothetical protein
LLLLRLLRLQLLVKLQLHLLLLRLLRLLLHQAKLRLRWRLLRLLRLYQLPMLH